MAESEGNADGAPTLLRDGSLGWLPRARSLPWVLSLGVVTFIAAVASLALEPPREYHSDEGVWLAASDYYFRSYFVERDWSRERWSRAVYHDFGSRNPVIGKYAVGGLVYLAAPGENVSREMVEFKCKTPTCVEHWDNVKDRQPPPRLLARGRNAVIVLGCLGVLSCYVLLVLVTGSAWIACLSSVFLAFDPLFVVMSGRIMMDVPAVTFGLACLALAALFANRLLRNERRGWVVISLSLGICWSLAWGCKLTNAIVIPISAGWIALASLVAAYRSEGALVAALRRAAWPVVASLLCAAVACLAFTVLTNPFMHHDPIAGLRHVLEYGGLVVELVMVPESVRIHGTAEALKAIYEHNFGLPNAIDTAPFGLDVVLAAAGSVCLLIGAATGHVFRRYASWMLLIWFVPSVLMMILFTPFRWDRWYVTLEPGWGLLQALGVAGITLGLSYTMARVPALRARP